MLRVLKRSVLVFMTVITALFFSGCAELTGLEAQSLMSPPKTTADRQAIYALMRGDQSDVSLVYPKNGEFRSAVISRDLDGDSVPEVVSFCSNSEAGGIRLQFFAKREDGAWYSLSQFVSTANQVDKVFFGDLTGDGQEEIVVGWGDPLTSTSSISVYNRGGDAITEMPLSAVAYSEILLTDFDGDTVQELFVMDVAGQPDEEGVVYAPLGSLYRFDGAQPYVSQTVPLDAAVTRYSAAVFTKVSTGAMAAVLDGVKADGRMITQIVGYDQNSERLLSPLSNPPQDNPNPTDRASAVAVTARDVNGDGVVEVPSAELVYEAGEGVMDSTAYCLTWNTYDPVSNVFTPVNSSIVNASENYYILLPSEFENIACVNNTVTRTATFFSYTRKNKNGGLDGRVDMFAVSVLSEEEWTEYMDTQEAKQDILLDSVAGRVYVLSLQGNTQADSALIRSITTGFRILSE